MTTDSDSECSYVANLVDFNVIRVILIVIVIKIVIIRVILIVIREIIIIVGLSVIQYEKKFTEIESQIHRMHNVKWLVYDG